MVSIRAVPGSRIIHVAYTNATAYPLHYLIVVTGPTNESAAEQQQALS